MITPTRSTSFNSRVTLERRVNRRFGGLAEPVLLMRVLPQGDATSKNGPKPKLPVIITPLPQSTSKVSVTSCGPAQPLPLYNRQVPEALLDGPYFAPVFLTARQS